MSNVEEAVELTKDIYPIPRPVLRELCEVYKPGKTYSEFKYLYAFFIICELKFLTRGEIEEILENEFDDLSFGSNRSTSNRKLKALVDDGFLEMKEQGSGHVYRLSDRVIDLCGEENNLWFEDRYVGCQSDSIVASGDIEVDSGDDSQPTNSINESGDTDHTNTTEERPTIEGRLSDGLFTQIQQYMSRKNSQLIEWLPSTRPEDLRRYEDVSKDYGRLFLVACIIAFVLTNSVVFASAIGAVACAVLSVRYSAGAMRTLMDFRSRLSTAASN